MMRILSSSSPLLFFIAFCLGSFSSSAQSQKGPDLEGLQTGDSLGYSINMPNANTLCVGIPGRSINGTDAGEVRVYDWNGSTWVQRGAALLGDQAGDLFGLSVDMGDANSLTVGAPGVQPDGAAYIYDWNGSNWALRGTRIEGPSTLELFGTVVSMPTTNTVGVRNGNTLTQTHIYDWTGSFWQRRGAGIEHDSYFSTTYSIDMPDANTVGISLPKIYSFHSINQAMIYTWNGSDWVQKGDTIGIEVSPGGPFQIYNTVLSMPNPNTIATATPAAPYSINGASYQSGGLTRIFDWDGSDWTQRGSDIFYQNIGTAMDISMPTAYTIAISAPLYGYPNHNEGSIKIYDWDGNDWTQRGFSISDNIDSSSFGHKICMPDPHTLAVGSPLQQVGSGASGLARVYGIVASPPLSTTTATADKAKFTLVQPVQEALVVRIEQLQQEAQAELQIIDNLGRLLYQGQELLRENEQLRIEEAAQLPAGSYYLRLLWGEQQQTLPFVKG